jgi:hypothetical protein
MKLARNWTALALCALAALIFLAVLVATALRT